MTLRPFALGVTLALAAASAAHATGVLFTFTGPTPQLATPGFQDITFDAAASDGDVSFRIDGYRTLDGVGCCTDTFSLFLNSVLIFQGSWDMGGGGAASTIFLAPAGATADPHAGAFGAGGHTDVFVPLTLADGTNTLRFQFDGRDQGLTDEAWGLEGITVHGTSPTPEPAAWTLMILGLAGTGAAFRRRRALLA